ncbi:hypothetical protein Tco_0321108 [Tanacetum coccineum]
MAGYKNSQLKNKSFDDIQKLFDKEMKRVNTFIDFRTELVKGAKKKEDTKKAEAKMAQESSSKRAGDELEQEKAKKQKIDDDQEEAEMKRLMEIVPDEKEVAVDAIPLATKPPSIVDWKIIKEGKLGYYQIIRADGSSKTKHGLTRLEEGYERVLWGDLRTMFEHNIEDTVWRNLQGNKVGRIVGIKRLHDVLEVTAAKVRITAAKQNLVFSTWMAFRGNTRDLGSFREETDKITNLHQIHEEVLFIECGDGIAGIKRRRRDLSNDGVKDLVTASGRGRLKEDLESST